MLIQNISYNAFFPKVSNLRRKIFELEEKLSSYFVQPFNMFPVPDDGPEEIPRITAISKFLHSILSISLNNAQLTINYDENFQLDYCKCINYAKERIEEIFQIVYSLAGNKILFSGLTAELIFTEFNEINPLEIIKKNFLNYKSSSNLSPFDLSYKITFVKEEAFYINMTFTNIRLNEGIIDKNRRFFENLKEQKHFLGLTLDINDRYGFNYNRDYFSDFNKIKRIIQITDDIISFKINKIIQEGVFEL